MPRFGFPSRVKFKGELSRLSRSPSRSFRVRGRGFNFRFAPMTFVMEPAELQSYFFDRPQWKRILNPAVHKALSRVGAILMRTARGLIRTRKNPSKPGRPPSSWTGLLNKTGPAPISFILAPGPKPSVIIGPGFIKGPHKHVHTIDQPTIPAILEFGGRELVKREFYSQRYGYLPAGRIVKIEARPYMAPALEKKRDKVMQTFQNMLGRTPASMAVANSMKPTAA